MSVTNIIQVNKISENKVFKCDNYDGMIILEF